MKVKKVRKYGAGEVIPEGALYLSTFVETEVWDDEEAGIRKTRYAYAWHFFLVEVEA